MYHKQVLNTATNIFLSQIPNGWFRSRYMSCVHIIVIRATSP